MAQHDDKKLIVPTADELRVPNAWLMSLGDRTHLTGFLMTVTGHQNDHTSVREGDGCIIVRKDEDGHVAVAFARVNRSRVTSGAMTVYFDGIVRLDPPPDLASLGISPHEYGRPSVLPRSLEKAGSVEQRSLYRRSCPWLSCQEWKEKEMASHA